MIVCIPFIICVSRTNVYFLLVTVISFHEDPGPVDSTTHSKAIRSNTLNVLSQLSLRADLAKKADPITLTSVRKALDWDLAQENAGVEAASNLFYYLFDDWHTAYGLINTYHTKLVNLVSFTHHSI